MIALAVVGRIASGKSTVLGMLGRLGAETCSADGFARELTAPGQPALEEIVARFGESYRRDDGSLDRAALAELIFRCADARERLEGILHPAILVRIRTWLDGLRKRSDPPPVAAVEVLRLPRHLRARELFDVVWLCQAPEAVLLSRLRARDGLAEVEAQRRLSVQREQQVEGCDPDAVLDTGGALESLAAQVHDAWSRLARPSP